MPDHLFKRKRTSTFTGILDWLKTAKLRQFQCQNGLVPLFGRQREQWTLAKAQAFVKANARAVGHVALRVDAVPILALSLQDGPKLKQDEGTVVGALTSQHRNIYALLVSAMRGYDPVSTTMQSRWMTLQEVAEYLQLSKDMIYRLAQSGRIPAAKVGSRWRFRRERIDHWMEDMAADTDVQGSSNDAPG